MKNDGTLPMSQEPASAEAGLRPILVAGPQGGGKTSLITALVPRLLALLGDGAGVSAGENPQAPAPARYLKVDCLASRDDQRVAALGIPVDLVLADAQCPDHALVEPLTRALVEAWNASASWLIVETAGLCDRCTPFIDEALSLVVFDALKSVHAPSKMRVPLRAADVVVLTKAELVSPAEREILEALLRRVNPKLEILRFNGLTGEGLERIVARAGRSPVLPPRPIVRLRQALPGGWCDTCQRGLDG